MPSLEVRPFDESHLPDAGRLLADRHRRHRQAEPLLAARFEDPAVAADQVAAAFHDEHASGAVALRDGRVVGYLLGAPKAGDLWGPNVWVESAGQAVERAEDARDLYAAAAARWHDEGRTAHYVLAPASDKALVDAWFRLGFGLQHAHGIREPARTGQRSGPVVVRRAERADIPQLARLDLELPLHQGRSPVFSAGHLGSYEEALAEWEDDFDDPEFAVFVAELDDRVVGSAVGCSVEKSSTNSGLMRPDNAGFLGFAAVLPEARGRGAGRSLGEAVLAWCVAAGYTCSVTDWRATNLTSSRTWTSLGFRESFFRLHRLIGY